MQRSLDFDCETSRLLDSVGAEPLNDSGFEEEQPDPEFSSGEEQ